MKRKHCLIFLLVLDPILESFSVPDDDSFSFITPQERRKSSNEAKTTLE
jgi:hypothetical protein